jgi:hypothetical protein
MVEYAGPIILITNRYGRNQHSSTRQHSGKNCFVAALHVQADAKPHILEDEVGLQLIAPPANNIRWGRRGISSFCATGKTGNLQDPNLTFRIFLVYSKSAFLA